MQAGNTMPAKAFPGGYVVMSLYTQLPTGNQDHNTLAIANFDGNIVRQFNRFEKVDEIPGTPKDKNDETWGPVSTTTTRSKA